MLLKLFLILFFMVVVPAWGQTSTDSDQLFREWLNPRPRPEIFNWVQGQSCSQLIQNFPQEIFSRSNIDLQQIQFLKSTWNPYCSKYNLAYFSDNLMDSSTEQLHDAVANRIADYIRRTHIMGGCSDPQRNNRSQTKYNEIINADTTANPEIAVISDNAKLAFENHFEELARIAKPFCCGSNHHCLRNFHFRMEWCDPRTQSDCIALPYVKMHAIRDGDFSLLRAESRRRAVFNSKIIYTMASNSSAQNYTDQMTFHEMGHMCNDYWFFVQHSRSHTAETARRSLRIYQDRNASSNRCSLRTETIRYYKKILHHLGFNHQTQNCIVDLSDQSPLQTTIQQINPRTECVQTCKKMQLEEAIADTFSTSLMNHYSDPQLLIRGCRSARDENHPAVQELFLCLLKTPQFQNKFLEYLGCRRNE